MAVIVRDGGGAALPAGVADKSSGALVMTVREAKGGGWLMFVTLVVAAS